VVVVVQTPFQLRVVAAVAAVGAQIHCQPPRWNDCRTEKRKSLAAAEAFVRAAVAFDAAEEQIPFLVYGDRIQK
jgi:hypothetical protein